MTLATNQTSVSCPMTVESSMTVATTFEPAAHAVTLTTTGKYTTIIYTIIVIANENLYGKVMIDQL